MPTFPDSPSTSLLARQGHGYTVSFPAGPWAPPEKGLVVREPWISLLLDGAKTWELRGGATNIRGRIGLIGSGTGLVLGEAFLTGCRGPLSREELAGSVDKHRVAFDWLSCRLPYRNTHAWELGQARRYEHPVQYRHPQGAVIWVDLTKSLIRT